MVPLEGSVILEGSAKLERSIMSSVRLLEMLELFKRSVMFIVTFAVMLAIPDTVLLHGVEKLKDRVVNQPTVSMALLSRSR